jgi:hypothetical protein
MHGLANFKFCLITLLCHCSYIATYVANITVYFAGVVVRYLPKICRNLWKVGVSRSYSNCEIARARYWVGDALRIADSPNMWIHRHETHAELLRNSKTLSRCTSAPFLRSLKSPWAQVQMDSCIWSRVSCYWVHVFQSVFPFVRVWAWPIQTSVGPDIPASMWVICETPQSWERAVLDRCFRPTKH